MICLPCIKVLEPIFSDSNMQKKNMRHAAAKSVFLIWAAAWSLGAQAAEVAVQVLDNAGQPLPNAVVYAEPAGGAPAPAKPRQVEIEQKNKTFMPLVTVVQTGTPILFPNHDTVRHHVYSFSPAKTFELKLYSGVPGSPVLFDKPGTVVLGCNIHDEMVAYVQVVNTPYFGVTERSGSVRLESLPNGRYTLKAWYFTMGPNQAALEQPLEVQGDGRAVIKLNVKAVPL
ncbi:methylamine utilization protein [Herbaspirillum rubrisubalbicans]|uniref:Methylamine utilization protein n=1 Tax=Herbaspirillum rubrisubalbicans TaxID=80842 RepID=A0AAD0UAU7_9BURK|nr:methylamine utilization protein [Herbaspirillum rubrisubalbicans]AYR25032.1 methylamine utilization protein [Herbaspirillum rubrisubalbicans]